jgi:hypothetical protein
MKKAETPAADEIRPEYRRSDFGKLVRGKYVARLKASSNVVILDPAVAELFPNAAAARQRLLQFQQCLIGTHPQPAIDRSYISEGPVRLGGWARERP